nr:adenylosuccinate lyase family protein [uncultured Limnohabitans sp.]
MHSTLINSRFLGSLFSTPEMKNVFSDTSTLVRYTETEVALALAEGKLGLIPADAAKTIAERAAKISLDMDRLERETHNVGYPILPLVHQLAEGLGDAGKFLHWGATTQDIMDTALVLQIRAGLDLVEADLRGVAAQLRRLSAEYRDTPMAGRTHLQHALPVTFGLKTAIWLGMVERNLERLQQLRPRVLVGQFAGAGGTLASLGTRGLDVQVAMMAELKLGVPETTWHTARDGLAETAQWLGLVTTSLAKMALDVSLMMANEFGEVFEPFVQGRGASSTMPQKRNPISCEVMIGAAKTVRHLAGLALDGAVQDFERATGPWQAEWVALPEAFLHTAGAVSQALFMLRGLEVDTQRMRQNLDSTGGLIVAEAVMMGLAPALGRNEAHDVVYAACRIALEQKRTLADVLKANDHVTRLVSFAQIDAMCEPTNYLGCAAQMVDKALAAKPR